MMPEHILVLLLALGWIAERLFHAWAEHAWRDERRTLCERIQAGTLADYQAHRERREMRVPPLAEPPLSIEEATALRQDDAVPDLVAARTAHERLMEETP